MLASVNRSFSLKLQTQNALRVINEYQKLKKVQLIITTLSTSNNSVNEKNVKQFTSQQKIKVQLLPNCLAYYQMCLNQNVDNKIIIRHFKGGTVQIFVFYDKLGKELDKAVHHFVIKDQIMIKLEKTQFRNAHSIIIIFKSDRTLSMFTFRIDNISNYMKKKESPQAKSLQNLAKTQFEEQPSNAAKILRCTSEKKKFHKIVNVNFNETLRETPEDKQKRLLHTKIINQEKMQAAKKRVSNIEIYKNINRQAQKIVASCRKQMQKFEQMLKEQQIKKKQIVKNCSPLFSVIKFCNNLMVLFDEKQMLKKKTTKVYSYEKRFLRKLTSLYQQTKNMQPNKQERELLVLSLVSSSVGHYMYKVQKNEAQTVAIETIKSVLPGLLANLAMGHATQYKRIVRGVQRRWKSRFHSRNEILLTFADEQLTLIIDAHPQLQVAQKWYRDNNKAWKLCLQYQKQVANRMVDYVSAYHQKIQQIEEYKKINKQIIQNNRTYKKRSLQLLNIPSKPSFPIFRFFRDLQFLKSLIRGQLQLQFRKYKKKYHHLNQMILSSSPDQQIKKCFKKNVK